MAILPLLLWFVAVATLTFIYKNYQSQALSTFYAPANGFFATWVSFFVSAVLLASLWLGGLGVVSAPAPETSGVSHNEQGSAELQEVDHGSVAEVDEPTKV